MTHSDAPGDRGRPPDRPLSLFNISASRLRAWGEGDGRVAGNPAGVRAEAPRNLAPSRGGVASPLDGNLRPWVGVLRRAGVDMEDARRAMRQGAGHGTSFVRELLAEGFASEEALFRAIADELGLGYLDALDPEQIVMNEKQRLAALQSRCGPRIIKLDAGSGSLVYAFGNDDIDVERLRAWLVRSPGLRRLRIVAPCVMRKALLELSSERLLANAQEALFVERTSMSARIVVNGWQGAVAGALCVALPVGLVLNFDAVLMTLNVVAAVTFAACVAIRFLALTAASPMRKPRLGPVEPAQMPVYSVLVALYREREVVPELLASLGRLQWPRSKLEIKLVCEADDQETLSALRAHVLPPCTEIVAVPAGQPRTKPKALDYALPLCSGEFVTLYDAEDRPHPQQLVEAWQRFRGEGDDLACLQAPLLITNGDAGTTSRMFAFEYAGLFRALLPFLSGRDLLLPLGGTSNHFRREALVEAGGWDPYNVTEDADLGVRLKRLGYRAGVLELPTLEDAPEKLSVWMPQRVRWFKGWLQTWLVHMREPVRLYRDLGAASFGVAQVLMLGMFLSALLHPIFFMTLLYIAGKMALVGGVGSFEAIMLAIGFTNVMCGYGAFIALGAMTLSLREKLWLPFIVARTPLHWLLLSAAAWRALWELKWRPHHWNKTPHRPSRAYRQAKRRIGFSPMRRTVLQ